MGNDIALSSNRSTPSSGTQGAGSQGNIDFSSAVDSTEIASASVQSPTPFSVGGQGPSYIRDLLGPNSLPSTQVGSDSNMAYVRSINPVQQAISDYLSNRINQGRDLDPNINVEKKYTAGTSFEMNGKQTTVIDGNAMLGVAYHNFGGNVDKARNYVGTNELADAAAARKFPNAPKSDLETIGQSVNARLDKAASFSDIMNWQADVKDMRSDPAANFGSPIGNIGDVIGDNYSNLFNQNDKAINSVFKSNGVKATAEEFNNAFSDYRADPKNNNIPRSQLMQNFTNEFVKSHAASGSMPNGAAILDQMQTASQQNLQNSAKEIVQRNGGGGQRSEADPATLLGSSSYTPELNVPT